MTIAFGQVFWFCAIKLRWLTGGEDGLLGIPRPPLDFGSSASTWPTTPRSTGSAPGCSRW